VAKRYRSYWISAIVHGFDVISLAIVFTLAILGQL